MSKQKETEKAPEQGETPPEVTQPVAPSPDPEVAAQKSAPRKPAATARKHEKTGAFLPATYKLPSGNTRKDN